MKAVKPPVHGSSLAEDAILAARVRTGVLEGHRQLVASLVMLGGSCPPPVAADLHLGLEARLAGDQDSGEVPCLSPWLYLGYYELGKRLLPTTHHLANGGPASVDLAPRQPATVPPAALRGALDLIHHGLSAAGAGEGRLGTALEPSVVAFGDPDVATPAMWEALLAMFQEGGDFVEDMSPPSRGKLEQVRAAVLEARGLIQRVDPDLHELMLTLQKLLVLADPGPKALRNGRNFGGATTFFFRGGSLIRASRDLSIAAMVGLLVHEYAHTELFVLGQDQLLCHNSDDERHAVTIRSDPRPMNGILHALHVVSRVKGVVDRILQQAPGSLPGGPRAAAAFQALRKQQQRHGMSALAAAQQHARLTSLGKDVVAAAACRLEAA